MTLDQLKIGETARIIAVHGHGNLRHRLLDMGVTPRTKVRLTNVAPMGDPIEIVIRGYALTLRKNEARNILVEVIYG